MIDPTDTYTFALSENGTIVDWRGPQGGTLDKGFSWIGKNFADIFAAYEVPDALKFIDALGEPTAPISDFLIAQSSRGTMVKLEFRVSTFRVAGTKVIAGVIGQTVDPPEVELEARMEEKLDERLVQHNEQLQRTVYEFNQVVIRAQHQREQLQTILESATDAFISVTMDNTIVEWNKAAERIFGWTRHEVIGRDLSSLIIPSKYRSTATTHTCLLKALSGDLASTKRVSMLGRTKHNGELQIELVIWSTMDEGEIQYHALIQDVTEEKRTEARNEARYQAAKAIIMANNADEAIQGVLQAICKGIDWSLALMWSQPEADDHLCLRQHFSIPDGGFPDFIAASHNLKLVPGVGVCGRVYQQRAPVWLDLTHEMLYFCRKEAATKYGFKTGFGFPVLTHGKMVGAIELFSRTKHVIDQPLLDALSEIGQMLGPAIARKYPNDTRRRKTDRSLA